MMNYIIVFLISMVPLIELRGSILQYTHRIGLPFCRPISQPLSAICCRSFYLSVLRERYWSGELISRSSADFQFCLRKARRGGKSFRRGRQRFVCGAFIVIGHSASRGQVLDRNSGNQSSGYGFQVQCGGCYVRCTGLSIIMGAASAGLWRAWRIDWLETYRKPLKYAGVG